jgi:SSS family solute:Na+ symporter
MVVAGLAWIPFMADISDKLYHYLQSVQSYISPPIAAVFLFGVFWWRANGLGAIVSMLVGFALGAFRLILELNADQLTEGTFWHSYAAMNFMHMSILLFITCSAVLIIVSLASAPEPKEKLAGLTYATTHPETVATDPHARRWRPILITLTILLLATVTAIWLYFS